MYCRSFAAHCLAFPQQSPSQQNSAFASHTLSLPCRCRAFSSMPLRSSQLCVAIPSPGCSCRSGAIPLLRRSCHIVAKPPLFHALPQPRRLLLCRCISTHGRSLAAPIIAFPLHIRSMQFLRQTSFFFAIAFLLGALPCHSTAPPILAAPLPISSLLFRCRAAGSSPFRCMAYSSYSFALFLKTFLCHRHAFRADPSLSNAGQSPCNSSQYSAVALCHLYRQGSSRPFCPGYTVCRMQTAPSSRISRYR